MSPFSLTPRDGKMDADLQVGGVACALDSKLVSVLFTFADVDKATSADGSFHLRRDTRGGACVKRGDGCR